MLREVEDRASSIRVTSMQASGIGRKGYVKVETNAVAANGGAITGWGEINNMETKIACALAESLGELVIGENPTRVEHLWQRLFRARRNLRGGGLMVISEGTARTHVNNILGKLRLTNRLKAALYALRGWLASLDDTF